jgi:hypothetical protein
MSAVLLTGGDQLGAFLVAERHSRHIFKLSREQRTPSRQFRR